MALTLINCDLTVSIFLLLHTAVERSLVKKDAPSIFLDSSGTWNQLLNISSLKGPAYYTLVNSKLDSALRILCESSHPIQWNITGTVYPPDMVKIFPTQRDFEIGIFVTQLFIDVYNPLDYPALNCSARISCEHVDQPVKTYNYTSLVSPPSFTVTDSKVIPCPTTNPVKTDAPTLHQTDYMGNEQEIRNSLVTYHPTEGFLSQEVFNGTFICKQGSYNETIVAVVSYEYIFTPKMDTVSAFLGEYIQLECFSKSKRPLEIEVNLHSTQADDMKVTHKLKGNRIIVKVLSKLQGAFIINGTACHICKKLI